MGRRMAMAFYRKPNMLGLLMDKLLENLMALK